MAGGRPRPPEHAGSARGFSRPVAAALLDGLPSATEQPVADEHRAGPDGQQPAGEEGAPHAGERQDQSSEGAAPAAIPALSGTEQYDV